MSENYEERASETPVPRNWALVKSHGTAVALGCEIIDTSLGPFCSRATCTIAEGCDLWVLQNYRFFHIEMTLSAHVKNLPFHWKIKWCDGLKVQILAWRNLNNLDYKLQRMCNISISKSTIAQAQMVKGRRDRRTSNNSKKLAGFPETATWI